MGKTKFMCDVCLKECRTHYRRKGIYFLCGRCNRINKPLMPRIDCYEEVDK